MKYKCICVPEKGTIPETLVLIYKEITNWTHAMILIHLAKNQAMNLSRTYQINGNDKVK